MNSIKNKLHVVKCDEVPRHSQTQHSMLKSSINHLKSHKRYWYFYVSRVYNKYLETFRRSLCSVI